MLPSPSPDALSHSQRVSQLIRTELDTCNGWIDFARYMELALYAPGLGYYAAGAAKFGAAGDFVTAPELSPLFGRTLAHQAAQVLAHSGGDILELGAGSGKLAVDVLLELERLGALPASYCILEVSADLHARQHAWIAARAPHLLERVQWLTALPVAFSGVMLANEVLDALPVHCVQWKAQQCFERGVAWRGERLDWASRELTSGSLWQTMHALPVGSSVGSGVYSSEINLAAAALLRALAESIACGALIFIDYGFPQAEYYHPQRHMGTLRAHYRHHALDDPFYLPGLCDLTAHVDFSAVAAAAVDAGLQLAGYTSQASFLINAGITERLMQTDPTEAAAYLPQANAVQRLISPAEMGELFKVIAFSKKLEQPLVGFSRGDRSHTL
jgi:SAM-dependent MidA family methyltransferase